MYYKCHIVSTSSSQACCYVNHFKILLGNVISFSDVFIASGSPSYALTNPLFHKHTAGKAITHFQQIQFFNDLASFLRGLKIPDNVCSEYWS